jgi:hypothetical protein
LFQGRGLVGVHPIGGLLGLAGGGEDGAGVVFQYALPGRHVSGMVRSRMVWAMPRSARIMPLRISTEIS